MINNINKKIIVRSVITIILLIIWMIFPNNNKYFIIFPFIAITVFIFTYWKYLIKFQLSLLIFIRNFVLWHHI